MHPITDAAATFGGRFNLILDPHDHCVYQNAFGDWRERPLDLTVGVKTPEGEVWALPFTSRAPHFPFVEQFDTLTTIEYRAVHPGLWIELRMRIRAPFYPREVRISTAPVYYVDVEVRPLKRFRRMRADSPLPAGELVFELRGEGLETVRAEDGFGYSFASVPPGCCSDTPLDARTECRVQGLDAEPFAAAGLRRRFDLTAEPSGRLALTWSAWAPEPVLEVAGEKTPFKYRSVFGSHADLLKWACVEREEVETKCDFLDRLFTDWSLGGSMSDMAALAFHSFLADTWWTTRKDGRDWFSVCEGPGCRQSAVDVEYNNALLYFALWPDLLKMLLDQWAELEKDGSALLGAVGKGSAFLSRDLGACHVVGRPTQSRPMGVEANADYLLLLTAWAGFTGNLEEAAGKVALGRRLAEFIFRSDSSGNGVPDRAVANAIDDAGPALQYGPEQVYLAFKSHAALWAFAELEQKCGLKGSQAERWRAFTSKGIKTIEDEGWVGDHYAVTLARTTEGMADPRTDEPLPAGELTGWNAYSVYTTNGLLYLFLSALKMPRWKMNRLRRDVENAHVATATPYGDRHTSGPDDIVWFSQNMWRDFVAAYLGIDMLHNVERYRDYQVTAGDSCSASPYCDTTEGNDGRFSSRGAAVFGAPLSAAGLGLNRLEKDLVLRPVRSTLTVPLLPLADWAAMRVPVLNVTNRDGVAVARISENDLLKGLTLRLEGAELEPE
ncbi:MAG: hypothetical protein GXY85_09255 [Candidatus Brocadiaceae bacterium]|nr:hypothetical protein [Candidatus Brocadiaceae bacterium]